MDDSVIVDGAKYALRFITSWLLLSAASSFSTPAERLVLSFSLLRQKERTFRHED
jgi:hypothetical protein